MVRFLAPALVLAATATAAVDFESDVQPLLEAKCLMCHNSGAKMGGVVLDTADGLTEKVKAGAPEESPLFLALSPEAEKPMPPMGPLEDAERELIQAWIAEGANLPASFGTAAEPAAAEATAAGGGEESELARKLHARIADKPASSEMEAYAEEIPHTNVSFRMLPIPGGSFMMGSPESEPNRKPSEGPQREVEIDPFWMMETETTWDLYRLFMFSNLAQEGQNPDELVDAVSRPTKPYVEMSFGMGVEGYPAISMTQHAARKFTQWLSAKTGAFYRLPTEAEWEYACRAGTTTAYSFGDDPAQIGDYAWYWDNSAAKYQKVGEKKPNPWGLHDMHGNVMEWTLDAFDEEGYPETDGPLKNPYAMPAALYPRTARGGSWNDDPDRLRCAARVGSDAEWKMQDPQLPKSIWYHTDAVWLGFRVVRPLNTPSPEVMDEAWNNGRSGE